MNDPIAHPTHYTANPSGVECIQFTRAMPFALGNVVKYLWRAEHKGTTAADWKKAQWYLRDHLKHGPSESPPILQPHHLCWAMRATGTASDRAIYCILIQDLLGALRIIDAEVEANP